MKEEWKEALDTLRNEDKWRITKLPDGQIDPYGSTTIHGAVAKVIVGSHYDPSKKVDFTLEQFFSFSTCWSLRWRIKTCHTWMAEYKPTI
jgi:hypothetical protein